MIPFISEEEFMPLSMDDIEFLLELAASVSDLSEVKSLPHEVASLLEVARTQILRLTAMTCAGYELYTLNNKLMNIYLAEVERLRTLSLAHGVPPKFVDGSDVNKQIEEITTAYSNLQNIDNLEDSLSFLFGDEK